MNIVIIGLGSMGKRRLRLLNNHFTEIEIYGIDTNDERRAYCETEFNIKTYSNLSKLLEHVTVNCAFICTAPLSHHKIIQECLENKLHIFTELNLVSDGYEENMALAKEKNKTLFLSSTALYRKEMQYIIKKLHENSGKKCYNYHVGQYLPDWHPWESYQDYFIGDKRTNGCRELLAIELPWILTAFGQVTQMHVIKDSMTSLKIDYPDFFSIQLIHEDGSIGNLIIDVVSREAVRKLEIVSERLYIEWQGKPDSLRVKNLETKEMESISLYQDIDKLEGYSSTIIENMYLDEIKAFFEVMNGTRKNEYSFEEDLYTIKVMDEIEG